MINQYVERNTGEECGQDEGVDRKYRCCYFGTCFVRLYLGVVSVGVGDDLVFAFGPSVDETFAKDGNVSLVDSCGDPDGMSVFSERDLWSVSGPCGQDSGADKTECNAGNDQ